MKVAAFSSPSNTTSPGAPKYATQLSIVVSRRGAVRPFSDASHTGVRPVFVRRDKHHALAVRGDGVVLHLKIGQQPLALPGFQVRDPEAARSRSSALRRRAPGNTASCHRERWMEETRSLPK